MRVLIIGCGYVGKPLGELLVRQGHRVSGLRRTGSEDADLRSKGIEPLRADITDLASLQQFPASYDAVVSLVSSSKGGTEDYRSVYLEGTRNLLKWLGPAAPRIFVYTSSTSVYAQSDGSWVTEENRTEPDSPTSQILIETERELRAARDRGFPAVILRASGIYGPGRGHLFKQFLRGEATMRDEGRPWLNMIHVTDLAAAIGHLLSAPELGAPVYNATDNEPVTQLDFFTWLSANLKLPLPVSAPAEPARKRGLTNKRVSNALLRSTGFRFTYPTFREGYGAEMRGLGVVPEFS